MPRPTLWTNTPTNFSVGSMMPNENVFFTSGKRYPPTSGGLTSHWTFPVGTPALSTLSARHSQNTRTVFSHPHRITVIALCTLFKSRSRLEHTRSNRAHTDWTRSSRSKQTSPWTLTLPPASSSIPRPRGPAPSCFPKKFGEIRITVNNQKLNKVTEIPQIAIPTSIRRLSLLDVRPFLRVHSGNHPLGDYPFLHPQRTL